MMAVPTLRTARYTLRALQRGDEVALFPTLSDPDQCAYLSHPPFDTPEQLWGWLADPDWPGRSWIAVDADDQIAARLVAMPAHVEGVVEIGYITRNTHQRQGVARECATALIDHLFDLPIADGGARKLMAVVDPRNDASVALIEALGFAREALLRDHEETHIGMCDVYWYGLLKREARPDLAQRA